MHVLFYRNGCFRTKIEVRVKVLTKERLTMPQYKETNIDKVKQVLFSNPVRARAKNTVNQRHYSNLNINLPADWSTMYSSTNILTRVPILVLKYTNYTYSGTK